MKPAKTEHLPAELARVLRDVPPGIDFARALPWLALLFFWVAVTIVVAVYA